MNTELLSRCTEQDMELIVEALVCLEHKQYDRASMGNVTGINDRLIAKAKAESLEIIALITKLGQ